MKAFRRIAVVVTSALAVCMLSGSKRTDESSRLESVWSWLVGPVSPDFNLPRGALICLAMIAALTAFWVYVEWRSARRRRSLGGVAHGSDRVDGDSPVTADSTLQQPTPESVVKRTREPAVDSEPHRSSESRVASTNVIPGVVEDDGGQTQVIAASDVELETEGLVGTEALSAASLLAGLGSEGGAFTRPISQLSQDETGPEGGHAPAPTESAPASEFECTQILSAPSPVDEHEFECTQVLAAPDDDLECTQVLLSPLGKSASPEDGDHDQELIGEIEELMGKKLG